ncbi:hypothetical protein C7999DRAFT_44091 [Corynascus novoguineensis]|uniref:F-box domain-containing protein n=1 Tax=Corynascus novoguineensis TaxID=1126955 RepID=A0AAN7HBZ5_9PEZI|nr:hypothetical protein C7999DRAFT_44091 [Corynascus novoguineensis]
MSFDVFCAVCGGPVRQRRARVARRRETQDENSSESAQNNEDHVEAGSDRDWYSDDEDHSYDPDLVSEESLRWLGDVCCIGLNIHAPDGPKPRERGLIVFPLHQSCLEILTDVLTDLKHASAVEKQILFTAMVEKSASLHHEPFLDLDYGIAGRAMDEASLWFWDSIPGFEYSVTSPVITPGFTEMFGKHLAESRAAFELQRDDFSFRESRNPQIQEPFTRLPSEILHRIFLFLSGDDVLNTLKASWSAFMPWMTALLPVLDERQHPGRDFELSYKTVYMWLNKITTPCYGSDGPFLSLANRRRIWGHPLAEPDRSITEHTICRHMVLISNDQPSLDDPWPLKTTLPVILEAYWRDSRHLVGFSAVVGNQKRTFGLDCAGLPHVEKKSVLIRGTEIYQLLFFLDQADPNTPATTPPGIAGLDVYLRGTFIRLP